MRRRQALLVSATVICSACAHAPNSFRLVQVERNTVLVPPGVKDAMVARASVRLTARAGKVECPPSPGGLRISGKSLIATREALTATTADELNGWLVSLERKGCLGSGEAFTLTAALIDSLPLELAKRRSLLGASEGIVLTSVNSLRVVSPVFRPGTPAGATAIADEPAKASQGRNGASVNVEIKANPDLTGYEIAWYDVLQRTDGAGFRIAPRSAEVHIEGKVEKESAPGVDRFALGPDARWFRYFLMTRQSTDRNDYNIVVLSGHTPGDLESRTQAFAKDAAAYLRSADKKSFAAMTPQFGVNPYIRVKLQGVESDLELGSTVRQAIEQSAGRGSAVGVLSRLTVLKPHGGKLSRVEWDRGTQTILNLTLEGGEEIAW